MLHHAAAERIVAEIEEVIEGVGRAERDAGDG